MQILNEAIVDFFKSQSFVIVSTIDRKGSLHNSCKGIVGIGKSGSLFLFDLYRGKTFKNLKQNSRISVTAVDEHKFIGYCLKGRAKIINIEDLKPERLREWEKRIANRITQRIIKNIHGEKGHPRHPEALLPKPEYLIVMKTDEVVDLTPHKLKQEG